MSRAGLAAIMLGAWLVVCPLGAAGRQGTQPLDRDGYNTLVREALAAARRGDRLGLEDSAGRLAAVDSVRLPDGSASSVDNGWLAAELRRNPPDLERIAERLGSLADTLAQPPGHAPADALAVLAELLSRPPYARPPDNQSWRWLEEFLGWLLRILELILRPLGSSGGSAANPLAALIGLLGIALLAGVVVYIVRGIRRGMVREQHAPVAHLEEPLSARQALDQAGDLARDGDYRTAVRFLYLAALLRLHERRLLRYDRALTNREYLERVRDQPELRQALAPIVDVFDRVWYGHDAIDAETFERYRAQVEQLGR